MSECEFLEFIPISGEKHIGVAVVLWRGEIVLRYKVFPAQDGAGYWIAPGALKMGVRPDGKDNFLEYFSLDSNYKRDKIKDFVVSHVTACISGGAQKTSTFSPATTQAASGTTQGQQPSTQQGAFWDAPPF